MRSNLLFVLVVCGVVVVGCGGGKNGQGTVSVSLPGSFRIEVTIDSNGGEIVVQDRNSTIYGARIKIEKGALNVPTNITLEEETSTDVQGERSLRFGPSGTTFTKPAPVSAPYTDELVQKYEIDPQEMLLVLDNGDDIVEVIQPTSVDTVGRKVNGEIDHFSVLKPIDHRILLLMRDPYAFIDGTPVPITVIFPQMSGSVPSPLIARSKTQTMITVGKGKLANVGKPGERTLFLLPGITASPTTYYYDEQQNRENQNDFSFLLRNDPAFSSMYDNVVFFKYPTGKSVEEVAKQFATLFRRFVPQGTRVDLLGHSLGCMVIRQAIEVEGISPSVEDVFFLSGPHEGGELAKLVTFFTRNRIGNLFVKKLLPSGEQVTIGSSFITNLNANFPGKKLASTKYHFVASKTDELVNPNSGIPAFMNPSPSDTLLLDNETHWGIHGNARTNDVANQIRLWKGYPPLQPTISWTNVYTPSGWGGNVPITIITIDPQTPATVYAVQNNYSGTGARIFKTIDGGTSWTQIAQRTNRISAFIMHPTTPTMLFAVDERGGIQESMDGGQIWVNPNGFRPGTARSIAIAANGSYLLAVGGSSVYKKIGTAGWLLIPQPTGIPQRSGPAAFPVEPRVVAIDPVTPSTAYIGTYTTGGYSAPIGEGVYETTDEGQTWTVTGLTTGNMSALVLDPKTPTTVYAVEYHDRIYKTTNGGRSWIPLSGIGLPYVETVAVDPRDPSILYTASKDAAYRSRDGGNTWVDISTGFPANTVIWTFAVDPTTGAVYAGTSDGIFKTQ